MQLIEIRLGTGLLIVGTPLAIDPVMLRADDPFMRGEVLRKLHTDRYAMARVRTLYPMLATQNLDPWELVVRLVNDLRTGRLQAAYIRESGGDVEPMELPTVRASVVHLELPGKTVLFTTRGMMPAQFKNVGARSTRSGGPAGILSSLDPEGPEIRILQRQIDRLTFGIDSRASGEDLKRALVTHLASGQIEAVVLTSPGDIAMARARRETPVPVETMGPGQRVAEALLRSRRYLDDEILSVVEEMVRPDNLTVMAALLFVAAAAQVNPVTAALVDSTLVMLAWISGGMAAVTALGLVFTATLEAADADSEESMEEAAKQYAKALTMLGASVLQALMARSFSRKGGTQGTSDADFAQKLNDAARQTQKAAAPPVPPSGRPQTRQATRAAQSAQGSPPPLPPAKPTAAKPPQQSPGPKVVPAATTAKSGKNEVTWTLDAQGRPVAAEATLASLQKKGIKRGSAELAAQDKIGAAGKDGDDAGHIIGHRFMGDQGEKNLFPQDSNFNRGAYKTLENEWAAWIENGGTVKAKVNLVGGTPERPDKVEVVYKVFDQNGKQVHKDKTVFTNEKGQAFDRMETKDIKKAMGKK